MLIDVAKKQLNKISSLQKYNHRSGSLARSLFLKGLQHETVDQDVPGNAS